MNTNFVIYGVLCVIAMFLMIFLQETVGKPMKESIDELNEEDEDEEKSKEDIKKIIPIDKHFENDDKRKYYNFNDEITNDNNNLIEEKKNEENILIEDEKNDNENAKLNENNQE